MCCLRLFFSAADHDSESFLLRACERERERVRDLERKKEREIYEK